MIQKYFVTAFLLLLIIFGVSCNSKKATENAVSGKETSSKIKLSKAQMQLANINTEVVKESNISNEIIFSGKLVVNGNTLKVISSKITGRIDQLNYKSPGELISKGTILYEIYSEELQSAQKEYLLALEKQRKLGSKTNDFTKIIEASKNKLLLWGMSATQIEQLKNTGTIKNTVPVYSTVSGYVQTVEINEGDYVTAGATVYKLYDDATLWIEAQAYSDEMDYIRVTAPITYTIAAYPDEVLNGTISYVNPELERGSKINLIRVEIPNAANKYKQGMMAVVKLKTDQKKAITVPANAVLFNDNGSTVWVQNAHSTFEVRMVTTGIRNADEIEITSGLEINERVVTSGAYLLNSEFILKNGADPMAGMKM